DLFALARLSSSSSVLEIGCGPGKASVSLARRGCALTCIEPGEHMAAIARRNLKDFGSTRVIQAAFEDWDPSGARFDTVFAASSWHWLDPDTRYSKAAGLLKPGGVLAIVSMSHAFPEGFDPIFTEIQRCYDAAGRGLPKWTPPVPDDVPDLREEIERT